MNNQINRSHEVTSPPQHAGNQFLVKCETPEIYRLQPMHMGGQPRQDMYQHNMPVATAQYHLPQQNQQITVANPQLYQPMFHYQQENRQMLPQAQHQIHQMSNHTFTPPYSTPVIQSPVTNYMSPPPPQMTMPQESFAMPAAPIMSHTTVTVPQSVIPLPPSMGEPEPQIPKHVSPSPAPPLAENFLSQMYGDFDDDDTDEDGSDGERNDRDPGSRRFRDDTIYDCPICKLRFSSQKKIEVHVSQAHPGAKPYKCPICGLGLTRMTTFKEHMNMHTGEKPFECTVCHESFGNSKSLYRHREKHETLAEKRCLQCKEEFSTWDDFKEHTNKCNRENLSAIHANTKPGDRPFICNVCGLGLSRIGSLNEHMNTHTGETPYACIWCKDRFPNTKSLSRHREKHDLSNPKCCAKCQKDFNDWDEFKVHVNAGTCKVKLNVCHMCKESFTRLPDLEKHFKVYHPNEDKLYSCQMCDKRFSHKNLLNTHLKTHSELPSFACQLCGRQFLGNIQLQRHLCTVHGEKKTYDCPVCGVSIAQLKCLIDHVKTHVKDVTAETMPLPMPPPTISKDLSLSNLGNASMDNLMKLEKDMKVLVKHEKPDKPAKTGHNNQNHGANIKEERDDHSFLFGSSDFFEGNDHFMDGADDDDDEGNTESALNGQVDRKSETQMRPSDAMAMSSTNYEVKTEFVKSEKSEEKRAPRKKSKRSRNNHFRHTQKYHASKYPSERLGELECLECGKRFMNLQNLNSHHIVHTGEKPYECHHCGVKLRYHKSLKRHMRLHIGEKPVPCEDPDCTETFKTKNQMDIHMRMHTDEKRRYTCPLCDKSFYQKKILRQHRKIHGERNYKCEICSRAFTENSRLREHMKVHTDDKPFLCSECGKSFRTKFSLDLHLKRHNNEARHLCKYCNKGFVVLSELKVHERTHTGEKPFVCPICYKHLSARRAVRAHMRIHTGEKPYACDWPDCPSVFRDKPSLRCHYRTHTGQKPFGCKFCDKHFTTSSNLRNHTARIHLK